MSEMYRTGNILTTLTRVFERIARYQQADGRVRVFGQARGDYTSGRMGADDDVIECEWGHQNILFGPSFPRRRESSGFNQHALGLVFIEGMHCFQTGFPPARE
jgi:hypothetical protein